MYRHSLADGLVLTGGDRGVVAVVAVIALAALVVGYILLREVLAAGQGTSKMQEIAKAVQEGAAAYLNRQFRTIGVFAVVVFALLFALPADSVGERIGRSGFFLVGAGFSATIGYLGMWLSTRANVRVAAAANTEGRERAMRIGIRTGGAVGMMTVGLGLFGASIVVMSFAGQAPKVLEGFGFGAALLAMFMRVGGGIFTKAADVGADLVGKVEQGIPEDDPRNPATIADNVGDNVGDCAGMAADLFESYEVTLVASIILGVAAFRSIGANPALGLIFPVAARAIGVLASIVGVFSVRATDRDRSAMAPINRGFFTASILTVVGTLLVALLYIGNDHDNEGWKVFGAVVAGLVLAQVVSRLTEHFTSTDKEPVQEIADSARTGPATTILSGTSTGLESTVWAIVAISVAIGVAIILGNGNIEFSFYLVALTGMGMLATTGVVVSEDTFGPVADNAAGIAEMSGEFGGEPERIMVSLDAVGNTTKAVTKGFAIGSAVIASVALFASFVETIGSELNLRETGSALFGAAQTQINVADPETFIGLLIGGSIAFLFSALAIRAVGRTAGTVVQDVRDQFSDGQIMAGTKQPDSGRIVDICTAASLRELATPALLAVLTPVIIGFGMNYLALGAFLAAVILTGQLMAVFLTVSGGAWDNAKKYIEDGHYGGKGSETHKAAVIGDTVGDPFKDTAGPALNPLIKVMNLVSLLILPAVISLRDNNPARWTIAGAALVVVLVAIGFSKRKVGGFAEEADVVEGAAPEPEPAGTTTPS
jgi:K(+)-stimulated pyrophosphate-energized sodium pump